MKIAVKCGNYKSWFFSTVTVAPQGYCASASEFTFYLAKSIKSTLANGTHSSEEHNTIKCNNPILPPNYLIDIDQQYPDEISKISTSNSAIEKMKDKLPVKLAQRGL